MLPFRPALGTLLQVTDLCDAVPGIGAGVTADRGRRPAHAWRAVSWLLTAKYFFYSKLLYSRIAAG